MSAETPKLVCARPTGEGAARPGRSGQARAPLPAPLFPQLRARKNVSRAQVAAHQRKRLQGAMVYAVSAQGYTATSVRELTALAGVTKKALYSHFASKQDCFLSTYDAVVGEGVARISAAHRGARGGERDWTAGLCRAFDAFVREISERPEASMLALVEVFAVGPVAISRMQRSEALFERMIAQSLAQAPDGVTLPPVLVKGIVHGIWYVARNSMLEGRPETMSRAGRELLQWMLAYRFPAAGSLGRRGIAVPALAAHAKSDRGVESPMRMEGDERTRMLRAAAELAASGGYEALTSGQIVERAAVSWDAFSEQFTSTEECFLSSIELLAAQALARALRAAQGAPDWASAVCRSLDRLLGDTARDPVFARAAFVEVFAAGAAGVPRRAALMRSFAEVLVRRAPRSRRPSPMVAEAIVGAVWGIVHHQVIHGRARMLPAIADHAAYLTLAPILGAERAVEAILAERPAGASVARAA